jgi:BirA family biotin operon repressor/biotin-[acetyl-CoA-carboxylase] ligase
LTILSAVSICEAIKEVTGLEAEIKWPNDILVRHKKVAGILTELNAEMDGVRFVAIGIGINVNNDKKSLPAGATSLKEEKSENINRIELLQEILRRIEINYLSFQEKGSPPMIKKWREYNSTLGKRVRVLCQKALLEGQAVDIDKDGCLLLRKDSGFIQRVSAGDVAHCR